MKRVPSPYLLLVVASLCGVHKKKWGKGEGEKRQIPLLFSLSLYPLPLSTPATQASWRLWFIFFLSRFNISTNGFAWLERIETIDASSSLVAYQGILYVFFDVFSRNFNSILYVVFVFPSRSTYGEVRIFYCCNNYNNLPGCHYPPTRKISSKTERIGLVYVKAVQWFLSCISLFWNIPLHFPFTVSIHGKCGLKLNGAVPGYWTLPSNHKKMMNKLQYLAY